MEYERRQKNDGDWNRNEKREQDDVDEKINNRVQQSRKQKESAELRRKRELDKSSWLFTNLLRYLRSHSNQGLELISTVFYQIFIKLDRIWFKDCPA